MWRCAIIAAFLSFGVVQCIREALVDKLIVDSAQDFNGAMNVTLSDHLCPSGDSNPACKSVCRWLGLTQSHSNGHCHEFLEEITQLGYSSPAVWKIFRSSSSFDTLLELLNENARAETLDGRIGSLLTVLSELSRSEGTKYRSAVDKLRAAIDEWRSRNAGFVGADRARPATENDGGSDPLPQCDGAFEAGDIVTFEVGGPNFNDISAALSSTAATAEALELRRHFDYGFGHHFKYGEHFDSYEGEWYKTYSKRVADFFANAGKGVADVAINVGKGVGDITANVGKALGKGFVYTGAGVTAVYASVRQTTSHTDNTKWTHTEIATGEKMLLSAYGDAGVTEHSACNLHATQIIISRFQGDGLVDAARYRSIAAGRAKMWSKQLDHYADSVGEWHRVIFGKCINVLGNAGHEDYWKAVTDAKVQEMWDYAPAEENRETGFWEGVKNNVRTHDANGTRVKPKAMFCSKLVSAIWSSTIGNPTESPNEPVRHASVNKLLPFNPGACSPWTMAQWLTGSEGRKYWTSCIADTRTYKPCAR